MMPFDKCPTCGGELNTRQVEKLLRGGEHTVTLKVSAEVCEGCGERLYSENVVKAFEDIRAKLQNHDFSHLKTLGQSFTVEADWPNEAIQPTA